VQFGAPALQEKAEGLARFGFRIFEIGGEADWGFADSDRSSNGWNLPEPTRERMNAGNENVIEQSGEHRRASAADARLWQFKKEQNRTGRRAEWPRFATRLLRVLRFQRT